MINDIKDWIDYWLFNNPRLFIPALFVSGVVTVLMLGVISGR